MKAGGSPYTHASVSARATKTLRISSSSCATSPKPRSGTSCTSMWTAPPPSTTTAIASAATRRGRRSASRKGHSRRNKYPRGHRQVAFPLLRRHVSWRANHRFISPSRRCAPSESLLDCATHGNYLRGRYKRAGISGLVPQACGCAAGCPMSFRPRRQQSHRLGCLPGG